MTEASLEEVAATAERVAGDQRAVARRVRSMQRQRERGMSWSEISDRQPDPGVIELLRSSWRLLASTTTMLTTVLAGALSSEGQSRRQIARRLGVTHQRVSALLGGDRNSNRPT